MASLKEVKARIGSVNSTKKITGAMKMVSSAKLKKAQMAIENISPYQSRLNGILSNFLATETDFQSDFSQVRVAKSVAIVVFSSNSSLCGAYNSNVIKELGNVVKAEREASAEKITIYPVGKKVKEAVSKMTDVTVVPVPVELADHPSFEGISQTTNELMTKFLEKEYDKVIVVYHHLKNTAVQKLTTETFLPIKLEADNKAEKMSGDYIVEPSKAEILQSLLPKALRTKMYACLLDSNASEHGARVVAMQVATDNANELINELTVLYNKTRQQAITSELLDIVGGAAALQN